MKNRGQNIFNWKVANIPQIWCALDYVMSVNLVWTYLKRKANVLDWLKARLRWSGPQKWHRATAATERVKFADDDSSSLGMLWCCSGDRQSLVRLRPAELENSSLVQRSRRIRDYLRMAKRHVIWKSRRLLKISQNQHKTRNQRFKVLSQRIGFVRRVVTLWQKS